MLLLWILLLAALTLNGPFSPAPTKASSSPAEQEREEQAILQSVAILSAKKSIHVNALSLSQTIEAR